MARSRACAPHANTWAGIWPTNPGQSISCAMCFTPLKPPRRSSRHSSAGSIKTSPVHGGFRLRHERSAPMSRGTMIDEVITRSLEKYFHDLDGQMPSGSMTWSSRRSSGRFSKWSCGQPTVTRCGRAKCWASIEIRFERSCSITDYLMTQADACRVVRALYLYSGN